MREQDRVHTFPRQRVGAADARQPFAPSADDFGPEAAKAFPVAGQAVVAAMAPDGVGKMLALIGQGQVPMALAPVEHGFHRAGEPFLGRYLANNVEALPRATP